MSVKHWQDIKKIAFVNPYPYYAKGTNEATLYPPLGLAYLCSVLEKYNIECRIIEGAAYRLTPAEIYRQIRNRSYRHDRHESNCSDCTGCL